ncbi:MAG: RNA-protein complex protein Nop10 [Thermoplasmatota archaeon]
MRKCLACTRYTLREACPQCGAVTVKPGPARYSPEDPYGAYRRKLKAMAAREGPLGASPKQGG